MTHLLGSRGEGQKSHLPRVPGTERTLSRGGCTRLLAAHPPCAVLAGAPRVFSAPASCWRSLPGQTSPTTVDHPGHVRWRASVSSFPARCQRPGAQSRREAPCCSLVLPRVLFVKRLSCGLSTGKLRGQRGRPSVVVCKRPSMSPSSPSQMAHASDTLGGSVLGPFTLPLPKGTVVLVAGGRSLWPRLWVSRAGLVTSPSTTPAFFSEAQCTAKDPP